MVRDIVIHDRAPPNLNFVALCFKDALDAYAFLWRLCTMVFSSVGEDNHGVSILYPRLQPPTQNQS
jgi:hypothetical protein